METIETFLRNLELETYVDLFKKNEIELEMLQDLTENDLKETLKDLKLPIGIRLQITSKIKAMNETGIQTVQRLPEQPVSKTSHTDDELRIVLLGKTGCGKSASGNTILGTKMFHSKLSGSSVTRVCSQNSAVRFNRKILIVDTPGIFDTEQQNEVVQEEIYKCIGITSPGPHAFIFVLSVTERYTEEEEHTIKHFVKYFGENIYKYFIVLFTRKDELNANNILLIDHIKSSPKNLQTFIQKCGNRAVAFNNNLTGVKQDEQVAELLDVISENVRKNGGKFYTNKMFIKTETMIKEVEDEKIQSEKKRLEKESKELSQKEEQKVETLQSQIEELSRKQDREEREIGSIAKQIEEYENKLQETTGAKRKEIQLNVNVMRSNLQSFRQSTTERAREIEKRKRDSFELCKAQRENRKKFKQELEMKLDFKRHFVRDEIRREIEKKQESSSWPSECTIL